MGCPLKVTLQERRQTLESQIQGYICRDLKEKIILHGVCIFDRRWQLNEYVVPWPHCCSVSSQIRNKHPIVSGITETLIFTYVSFLISMAYNGVVTGTGWMRFPSLQTILCLNLAFTYVLPLPQKNLSFSKTTRTTSKLCVSARSH